MMQWIEKTGIFGALCLSGALVFSACSDGGTGGGTGTSSSSSSGQGTGGGGNGGGGQGGAGLMPGECRSDADCDGNAESCLPPGVFPGCGACMNVDMPCTDDTMCMGANEICEPAQCACGGEKVCKLGCLSNMECGIGQVCEMLRCTGKPCVNDMDCPTNYACGQNQRCDRKACAADADCLGFCVENFCYEQAGACVLPVP